MRQSALFIMMIIVGCSFRQKELVITEKGFNNIIIGKTTLSQIKKKHPFARRTKTIRHVLFRTDEGRVGQLFHYWTIKIDKGTTCYFVHAAGTTKPVKLNKISFEKPANVKTDRGINLGTSSFRDVESKYGSTPTSVHEDFVSKNYDSIVFYSDKLVARDSIDGNFIVTKISVLTWH